MKHFATTIRIAQQLKADKRTIALILIVPVVLLSLLYYEFHEVPASPFDRIGPTMLAILPLTMMFLITSVAMLRERTTGTLEPSSSAYSGSSRPASSASWCSAPSTLTSPAPGPCC